MKTKKKGTLVAILMSVLLCLSLMPMTAFAAPGDVAIDEANFPDANFRGCVKAYDTNNDGILSQSELDEVLIINVDNKNITTLKGIEHFTKLETLYCSVNQLTALDLTKNPALDEMACNNNQLTALDVTKNPELKNLYCANNQLTTLDVTKNPKLNDLYCIGNKLTALDVTKNTELKELDCAHNQLTALDVTNNTELERLHCYNNQLTSLDLNANTNITNFAGHIQKYDIAVGKNMMTFDLKSLPGKFNPSKASGWAGASVSGNTLKLDSTKPSTVTYTYEARSGNNLSVTLNVSYKEEVKISFDKNGGSGTMVDAIALKDVPYKLPACGFTAPSGKEFKAWSINGTEKAVGDSITVNKDTTVKAIWQVKTESNTGNRTGKRKNPKTGVGTNTPINGIIAFFVTFVSASTFGFICLNDNKRKNVNN